VEKSQNTDLKLIKRDFPVVEMEHPVVLLLLRQPHFLFYMLLKIIVLTAQRGDIIVDTSSGITETAERFKLHFLLAGIGCLVFGILLIKYGNVKFYNWSNWENHYKLKLFLGGCCFVIFSIICFINTFRFY